MEGFRESEENTIEKPCCVSVLDGSETVFKPRCAVFRVLGCQRRFGASEKWQKQEEREDGEVLSNSEGGEFHRLSRKTG
jgi:hypothetical protein